MCLYYTTKVGEDYPRTAGCSRRVWGSGQYVYTLPRTSLALRLDPCSPEENKAVTLTMSDITLNAADTPARRMAVFCADVVSGVLSGALPRTGRRSGEHGWGRGC